MSRKEGGRGAASIEDSVEALTRRPENYIKKYRGIQITAPRNNIDNIRINGTKKAENKKWEEKKTVWIFQMIDKRNLIRENLCTTKKGKP